MRLKFMNKPPASPLPAAVPFPQLAFRPVRVRAMRADGNSGLEEAGVQSASGISQRLGVGGRQTVRVGVGDT